MKRFSAPLAALRLGFLGTLTATVAPLSLQAQQAAQPDQQELTQADNLANEGKLQEAADIYAAFEGRYATSMLLPQATLRLGYVYFRLGEHDKALASLQKAMAMKNAPPEAQELALSLIPQIISGKTGLLKPEDPARKAGFDEAVKQFDVFLTKYPNSNEFEAANYGKAVALYQASRYDEGITALRLNLTKYPKSETVLDTKYLLALTIGTLASTSAQKAGAQDSAAAANYDLAEKTLTEVVDARTDVALANDARFQTAEILFARASLTKGNDAVRKPIYQRALDAYRLVAPKDVVVVSQRLRIEAYKARKAEMVRTVAANPANFELSKRVQRVIDREQEKLSAIESRADQTLTARLKTAQIFFQLSQRDEARTLLNYLQPLVEDEQQKKEVIYYTALSLATQNNESEGANAPLATKAEETYKEFQGAYKSDPLGENLAVVVGLGFTKADPAKAIKYFQDSTADYPKGEFRFLALTQMAGALVELKRYDEALKAFQDILAAKPDKETSANAEYGIASVYQKTDKTKEAIAAFKKVRDTYAGTGQSELAAFWYGQQLGVSNDAKSAAAELSDFVKKYPKSDIMPNALYYLGQAQGALKQTPEAIATYTRLSTEFPKHELAPHGFRQRGQLLIGEQKFDEVITTMRELIKAYPDEKDIFQDYDLIAQIQGSQQQVAEQIATYESFVKAKPEHASAPQALYRITTLWREKANSLGRFVALNEEQKTEWKKAIDASIDAAVRLVSNYPEAEQVALGLQSLLEGQRMRQSGKLVTDAELEKYFQDLAEKFKDKPGTRSKVLFTLATHLSEKQKEKANKIMTDAYDPDQKYAPADLDLFGASLIEQKKYEEATKVYNKVAADYPLPAGALSVPGKVNAPQNIQEAQAIVLFGLGKILQDQKKEAEAGQRFAELEKLYGWSPKNLEGSYGIAVSQFQKKVYPDVLQRTVNIVKASTAPADLRAKAMLLLSRSHEEQGNYEVARDNYLKIGKMFGGVPAVAAEGLWRGGNLAERMAKGEISMPTPAPKAAKPAKATPAAKK